MFKLSLELFYSHIMWNEYIMGRSCQSILLQVSSEKSLNVWSKDCTNNCQLLGINPPVYKDWFVFCGNMKNRLHNNITIFCVVTLCNLIDRYLFLMFPSSGWEQDTLYWTTWCHISKHNNLHSCHCENFRSPIKHFSIVNLLKKIWWTPWNDFRRFRWLFDSVVNV